MTAPSQKVDLRYRGRIAPSPTGYLHLGHAQTFWMAQQRAQMNRGILVFRNEDLDPARSKPEFVTAMYDDLQWFGLRWQEGPNLGGTFGPYAQSERKKFYTAALEKLRQGNFIYPCTCSRKDLQSAASAPHAADDELIYSGTCRDNKILPDKNQKFSWRFRVPDGEMISFNDGFFGPQTFTCGKDFGDFVVWRPDGVPAYQLAVVVDDSAMQITEVVRGADLLISTARQILLYRALKLPPPLFFHCPLLNDENGQRLAKRNDALSLRTLRLNGESPEALREKYFTATSPK